MPREPAWSVPSINLQTLLTGGDPAVSLSTAETVEVTDLKYTIIDDKNVVFRNVHELAELYQATKIQNLVELVSFIPERVLLQQTIASVITRVQLTPQTTEEEASLEHDKLLQRVTKQIHTHILGEAETQNTIDALYAKREEIHS